MSLRYGENENHSDAGTPYVMRNALVFGTELAIFSSA
jgi:hypothetical protein